MKLGEYVERYALLCISLFVMAVGVAFGARSTLGISPISCPPYVLSFCFEPTIGQFTMAMHIVFIIGQIVLLRKNFQLIQLLQIPVAIVFGLFIDAAMWLTQNCIPEAYWQKLLFLLISCIFISIGVYCEVSAKVLLLAGEGIMLAISKVTKIEFGKVKMGFDSSLVIIGILISFIVLHQLKGVREGTIIAALLVGFLVSKWQKIFAFLPQWLNRRNKDVVAVSKQEKSHLIISIARQYGSGGHEIGEKLAKQLNIPLYDNAIIDMTASETHFSTEFVEQHEQNIRNTIWHDIIVQNYMEPIADSLSADDILFVTQSRILRKLASEGPCVIVGRCADYVLQDMPGLIRVYVKASDDFRVERIMTSYNLSKEDAMQKIKEKDLVRYNHYSHYAGKKWGASENYDLVIDSSVVGIDTAVRMLQEFQRI